MPTALKEIYIEARKEILEDIKKLEEHLNLMKPREYLKCSSQAWKQTRGKNTRFNQLK